MKFLKQEKQPESSFLFVPNIIGYVRAVLLLLSLMAPKGIFVFLYCLSYILDAADGYTARMFKQESQLGYIFDMALDRASSTILFSNISRYYPWLFPLCSFLIILDLISHMFAVASGFINKSSHKAQTQEPTEHPIVRYCNSILSIYYSRYILFFICLFNEMFVLNILSYHSKMFGISLLPFFLFKQLTNILQLARSSILLSTSIE
ncbi:CDP-diacylglycerol--inositol 3-phosphatidyltransferase [Nematocida sp. LUAm3]|nr:CDP-diacylglycerol--inositol 3-phosphatidyltransferase [Nematocida sp. LUAm3]KAI5175237.1 CDP-diacylglycerol--inositol 3-phosphatidyltransferase [Nematocida sp. LUAm2]KAI5178091.1 CDP-diacylglycerol--inositol 3-phosphatidyltransferase [Nematocida sp. LUAm1]